jgi:two-component system, response regulator PdtaR
MIILVVEDEPMIACAVAMELRDAGHEVLGPAYTVEEAEELVASRRPQLAMIDINLAGYDEGIALARRLRTQWGVPCYFVSGQVAQARANCDAALGVLPKPFDFRALVESVAVAEDLITGRRPRSTPRGLELFALA